MNNYERTSDDWRSNLDKLVSEADQSAEELDAQKGSYLGKAYTWILTEVLQSVPSGMERHIRLTKELAQTISLLECLNRPLTQSDYQVLKKCQAHLKEIARIVPSPLFQPLIQTNEPQIDTYRLIAGQSEVAAHDFEWNLNLALMMDIYNRTEDENLKMKISFLILQYLGQSAPNELKQSRLGPLSQLGFEQKYAYIRENSVFEPYVNDKLQLMMVPQCANPLFFLTDTGDYQPLLRTIFYVITDSDNWAETFERGYLKEVEERGNNLTHYLMRPFVCDFTNELGNCVFTKDGKNTNNVYLKQMEALEDKLKDAILRAAKKITAEHPELNQPEEVIAAYLIANTVCISRHTLKGLEILKGHFTNNLNQLLAALPGISDFGSGASITGPDPRGMLTRFLNQTGLRLGSVRGKAALFQFLDVRELLQYRKPLYYAPKGDYPIYFETRTGFLELEVFKRFKDRLNAKENNPHHQCIMGQATLKLTEGLLNKISDEGWKKIKEDFGLCALAQTALVRLQINLANADFHLGVNDESYSKAIELALAELSTLLTIFSPFAKGDFEQIYKRQLTNIPSELQDLVTIGIAKSAMNIFSGIKAAVDQTLPPNKEAVCEVGKEVYYEILQSLEKKVKESKPADLYVDEFYHNIVLIPSHTHYSSTDIIHSVTKLMETKPERVTVAIDDTIDFARSEKASALMKHLSKEIREGQVNLIFFRSGQKFDMLGMDNYYGAPFYMLKNGDPHWSTFDALFKHDAHQTDPLTIQWFCLANQSVFEEMESYRLQIFENTREILNHIPDSLKPRKGSTLYVCTSDPDVLAPFIEIKATTADDASSLHNFITSLQNTFIERKRPLYSRDSFGFTHANFILINHKVQQCTSIRLAPGINPLESRLIIEALEELSSEQSQK